jgi:hypothetical protein
MSALEEISFDDQAVSGIKVSAATKVAIKSILNPYFWKWFDENRDDVVTHISLFRGLIRYKVYVRDLEPLFIKLFGYR